MGVLGLWSCERKCGALYVTPALVAGGIVFLTLISRLTTCFKNHHPFGRKMLLPSVHRMIWVEIASRKPVLFDNQRLHHFSSCTNAEHPNPVGTVWRLSDLEEREKTTSSRPFPFIIRPATYKELRVVAYMLACSFLGVKPLPIDQACGSLFTSLKVGNNKDVCFTCF